MLKPMCGKFWDKHTHTRTNTLSHSHPSWIPTPGVVYHQNPYVP